MNNTLRSINDDLDYCVLVSNTLNVDANVEIDARASVEDDAHR